jgi:hypothetical protein
MFSLERARDDDCAELETTGEFVDVIHGSPDVAIPVTLQNCSGGHTILEMNLAASQQQRMLDGVAKGRVSD